MGSEHNDRPMPGTDGDGAAGRLAETGTTRREAIKKAAGAAAVAGTVWATPRVEGLSLVPAYASAATTQPRATGGSYTQTLVEGTLYGIHTFTSNGDFVRTDPLLTSVQVLVVGGGGGGALGGGGGGRVIRNLNVNINVLPLSTQFPVVVGAGGAGRTGNTSAAVGDFGNPNLDFEWNTLQGGDGGTSSFTGNGVTVSAAGGGGGGAMLYFTTSGLGSTNPLSLGRGRPGASGGGGGGINDLDSATNRVGGNGSNIEVGSIPTRNRGFVSFMMSPGEFEIVSGVFIEPGDGFAGGPGGGWRGASASGCAGAGDIYNFDGINRMFGQGGGGGSAWSREPTGDSPGATAAGYPSGWVGRAFNGGVSSHGLTGNNGGGRGGYVGTDVDYELRANGEAGMDGRGGGGGGGGFNYNPATREANPNVVATASGRGGNGIVIVRYPIVR